jgi:serine protease inhibitor ecotin
MSKYKNIPIKTARDISKTYDKDQVIVLTWDKTHGKTHVTTYGKTLEDCKQAAYGGNLVKRALGWPDELCQAKPKRIKK